MQPQNNIINPIPKGFAGLIANVIAPLNDNLNFKNRFGNKKKKYLLNATNLNYAALLTLDKGSIIIESVLNKPKSNLKKKEIEWDGYISSNSQIFLAFIMDKISLPKMFFLWVIGKIKIKGLIKMVTLLKIINFLKK